jgi:hypothetical protein
LLKDKYNPALQGFLLAKLGPLLNLGFKYTNNSGNNTYTVKVIITPLFSCLISPFIPCASEGIRQESDYSSAQRGERRKLL